MLVRHVISHCVDTPVNKLNALRVRCTYTYGGGLRINGNTVISIYKLKLVVYYMLYHLYRVIQQNTTSTYHVYVLMLIHSISHSTYTAYTPFQEYIHIHSLRKKPQKLTQTLSTPIDIRTCIVCIIVITIQHYVTGKSPQGFIYAMY